MRPTSPAGDNDPAQEGFPYAEDVAMGSLTENRRIVNIAGRPAEAGGQGALSRRDAPETRTDRLKTYRDVRERVRRRVQQKPRKDKGTHRWTREQCLEALRAFVDEHGLLERDDYERARRFDARYPGWRVLIALFGGYRAALTAAGLGNRRGAPWSEDEVDFLKDRAGTMTIQRLAQRLGRSKNAVWRKMYILGIQHKDNDGRYTAKELAGELGISPATVVARVRRGVYRGQKVSSHWRISHPEDIYPSKHAGLSEFAEGPA